MSVWSYFGLRFSPFDAAPAPSSYFAAPSHEEARALLAFCAQSNRPACAIVAEAGAGKSLLAQMHVQWLAKRGTCAAWCSGDDLGDSAAGSLVHCGAGRPAELPLDAWIASLGGRRARLVIDDADRLCEDGWRTLLGLRARTVRSGQSLALDLLGSPRLAEQLAAPLRSGLRRETFRIQRIDPLDVRQTGGFILHRLRAAGGDGRAIFSADACAAIHHWSRGWPGWVNLLCDNLLVDAFGAARSVVRFEDVDRVGGLVLFDRSPETQRGVTRVYALAAPEPPASAAASASSKGNVAAQTDPAESVPQSPAPAAGASADSVAVRAQLDSWLAEVGMVAEPDAAAKAPTAWAPPEVAPPPPRSDEPAELASWPMRHDLNSILTVIDRLDQHEPPTVRDQRAHRRFKLFARTLLVEVAHAPGRAERLFAVPRNLGRSGVGVVTERLLYPGTHCRVCLLDADHKPQVIRGRVGHCQYISGTASLYDVGIAFAGPIELTQFLAEARRVVQAVKRRTRSDSETPAAATAGSRSEPESDLSALVSEVVDELSATWGGRA